MIRLKHLRILDLLLKQWQGDDERLYIWVAGLEVKGDVLVFHWCHYYKFSGLNNKNLLCW